MHRPIRGCTRLISNALSGQPCPFSNYVDGNGINLFGNKTQGYHYHLAILAVAILFEIRFPEKCYLLGDIEYTQVEQMSRWVHSVMNTPVITPVCLDGQRLYQRLSVLYDNPRHSIKRFQALFQGSDEEQFATLHRYQEREPLDLFTHCHDTLRTIEDTIATIFTKLRGAPSAIELYLDSSEVLVTFCSCQPEQRAIFQEIIQSCEQKCREELEQTKTLISEMEQKMREAEKPKKGEPEAGAIVKASPVIGFEGKNLSEEEAYILKQVVLQTKKFKDTEEGTRDLGAQLARIITKHPDMFASEERSYYLEGIYSASYKSGFALRESAWHAIDQEQNLAILRSLFAYALVTEQEINFWHWRIHIFESQELWKYLLEAQHTDSIADN